MLLLLLLLGSSDGEPQPSDIDRPIAFSSFRHGQSDIYTMRSDGHGVRNLTHDSAPDFQLAWSPEGSVIAFVSLHTELSHSTRSSPSTSRATNGGSSPISREGTCKAPARSPDGSRIAFHVVYGGALDAELFVKNADGTQLIQLTDDASEDSDREWSPDGSHIAFVRDGRIETMDPNGGHVAPLTPPSMLAFGPVWSPGGDRIAFVGRRPDASQEDLFTIANDGLATIGSPIPSRQNPSLHGHRVVIGSSMP
jgi:TolB protein